MVLRNIKELDQDLITLNQPYKHNDDYYLGEINYNDSNFIIQTPILAFKNYDESGVVELLLDKTTLKSINKIDNQLIKLITENSVDWFKSQLSLEDARDIYKSSISFPLDEYDTASLRLNCINNFKVYDRFNPDINPQTVKYLTPTIGLIKLNCIIFYKHTCIPQWDCISLKIKHGMQLKTCEIVDDHEDTDSKNDEDVKVIVFNEKPKLF